MADHGIVWFYWGVDEWVPFEAFESEELEAAHSTGVAEVDMAPRVRLIQPICAGCTMYAVDFGRGKQRSHNIAC